MSQYTPGPWQVVRAEHTQLITATVPRGDVLVAEVRPAWDSGEANARLIAAAPDLLRLGLALLEYSKHGEPDVYTLNGLLAELEEVCAKAEGRHS